MSILLTARYRELVGLVPVDILGFGDAEVGLSL